MTHISNILHDIHKNAFNSIQHLFHILLNNNGLKSDRRIQFPKSWDIYGKLCGICFYYQVLYIWLIYWYIYWLFKVEYCSNWCETEINIIFSPASQKFYKASYWCSSAQCSSLNYMIVKWVFISTKVYRRKCQRKYAFTWSSKTPIKIISFQIDQ